MKLKEMKNTGVIIESLHEWRQYTDICRGQTWWYQHDDHSVKATMPNLYIMCCESGQRGKISLNGASGSARTLITLAEFKKEQGIMKYSAGDVLENGDYTEIIQGTIGDIYLTIDNKGIASMFTDVTFARDEYTLKTETTKTDMTVSELEKKCGLAAGSLNVVAE